MCGGVRNQYVVLGQADDDDGGRKTQATIAFGRNESQVLCVPDIALAQQL